MDYNYNRVVVTGGAGFIGSHIVDRLLLDGKEVCVIDNFSSGKKDNIAEHFVNSNCLIENADIKSLSVKKIFRVFRPEVVIHLAAIPGVYQSIMEPSESASTNIVGTANILAASEESKVERVLFASSSSVYGGAAELPTNELAAINPKSPYALQKYIGEQYCKFYSHGKNLDAVSLRLFNVFGPRQSGVSAYAAIIPALLESKKMGISPIIYGDGNQTRDFCYIDNVVDAFILASNYKGRFNGEAFNIAFGAQTSLNQLLDKLKINNAKYEDNRLGDVMHSFADCNKAKEKFNYSPSINIYNGLEKILNILNK